MLQLSPEILPPAATQPPEGEGPAWDEAFLRVESYLRAHHVESRVQLNALTTDIVREARARAGDAPVVAAMGVAHARIGAWFAAAGVTGDWADGRVRARARLALVLAEGAVRRPGGFLAAEPAPPDLVAALSEVVLRSGPEMRFSNMAAAPLEFGFKRPEDQTLLQGSRWLALRAAAGWLLITGIFGVLWAASH